MTVAVFGSINVDHVIAVERLPRPGETVRGKTLQTFHGGKGANQAVAAARAGASVTMIGAVGSGAEAEEAVANLRQNGVATDLVRRTDLGTGSAFICVDGKGENFIALVPGANDALAADAIPKDAGRRFTTLVCQGEVPLRSTLEAVNAYLAGGGGRVVVNLAPIPAQEEIAATEALLSRAHVLVLNQHEARALAPLLPRPSNAAEAERLAGSLAQRFVATVVVTLGAAGAVAATHDGETCTANSPPTDVIDTTGAGDAFVGVLAASLDAELGLRQALRRACTAGALACRRRGAQASLPVLGELESFLQRRGATAD